VRWPDVHTIPAYMTDPAQYWTFTVSLADPDSPLNQVEQELGGRNTTTP
jgi:hypothetical protein